MLSISLIMFLVETKTSCHARTNKILTNWGVKANGTTEMFNSFTVIEKNKDYRFYHY